MATSYNSYSGVDIIAVFGGAQIGELQGISWSISREKAPIYTMGSANPRSFSRGKRGVAGSLIFTVFDRHALLATMQKLQKEFWADNPSEYNVSREIDFNTGVPQANAEPGWLESQTAASGDISNLSDLQSLAKPYYSDQIPPFEVVLFGANEYGARMRMTVWGAEILNEGSGVSVDDIVLEQQMTFIARGIEPWAPLPSESNR